MSLIRSISGIRGIIGESLTPEDIVRYSAAFAQYCNRGKIVIGRDGRATGKIIGNIVSSTLLAMGCDVIALGVAPTPTIALAVEKLGAAGGIAITASHNPMQWNGLKFIGETGLFLNSEENKRLWSFADLHEFHFAAWEKIGRHSSDESFLQEHINLVLKLPYIDVQQVRKRKFKVVVDCINAAGGVVVPQILHTLGCDVIKMNCDVSGIFSRMPEPIPENLTDLCNRVCAEKADLGIAVDPDVDRLVLIDEKGNPLGEEYTITSVVKYILEKHRLITHHSSTNQSPKPSTISHQPSVVVNLSTTRAVDDVAKKFNATVIRAPVGEINVAQKMKEIGAIVGGEGNGGVILPEVHYGRDALVGIALILQQLTEFGGKLSEFKATLPQYTITKSKIDIGSKSFDKVIEGVKKKYKSTEKMNTDDGLKIDLSDSWIHLRKSNTEPIIRIISEAKSVEEAEKLINEFKKEIS